MVHGILLSRVPRAEVDDLVQDVFLSAMQRLASLREAASFGGWLAAIARNRATDHLRRTPVTTELPESLADDGRGIGRKRSRSWRSSSSCPMRTARR
jgi:RNA polymerase sigma-70 factor (ECF subfamily)